MTADRNLLYQHVKFLTELRPFRNHRNRNSLEQVCDYLQQAFGQYGLENEEQPHMVNGLALVTCIAFCD